MLRYLRGHRAGVRLKRFREELPTSEFLMRLDGNGARVRYMPDAFSKLIDTKPYEAEQKIALEAHRGSRRASVRREYFVPESLATRMTALAQVYGLARLESFDPYGEAELDQAGCRELAYELDLLVRVSKDPMLVEHIAALHDLADFCWQADEPAWLTILGL